MVSRASFPRPFLRHDGSVGKRTSINVMAQTQGAVLQATRFFWGCWTMPFNTRNVTKVQLNSTSATVARKVVLCPGLKWLWYWIEYFVTGYSHSATCRRITAKRFVTGLSCSILSQAFIQHFFKGYHKAVCHRVTTQHFDTQLAPCFLSQVFHSTFYHRVTTQILSQDNHSAFCYRIYHLVVWYLRITACHFVTV